MRSIIFVVGFLLPLPGHPQSLRDAVEAAWARQPASASHAARVEEIRARRDAAVALIPEPPSISVAHRTDQTDRNRGRREWEAEFDIPLWLPGESSRRLAVVEAERAALDAKLLSGKWRIASAVREAYWEARLGELELQLARRKVEQAAVLAADVERRVMAGDLARVDLNQAQALEQSARAALAEKQAGVFKAAQVFTVLTGLPSVPAVEEQQADAPPIGAHPQLASLQRSVAVAQARLAQIRENRRDNPELSVGVQSERGEFNEPFAQSLNFRVRIPLGTDARNRPRIAAANLEMIEAQAEYGLERRKIEAEIDLARKGLELAFAAARFSERRFALAADTQRLYARAFTLGELDLPARLRAENERFEAELALTRARLEVNRLISRLNQALGVLP